MCVGGGSKKSEFIFFCDQHTRAEYRDISCNKRLKAFTANDFWIKIFFLPKSMDAFDQTHFSCINIIKMYDGKRGQTQYSMLLLSHLQLHKVYPTRNITT